MKIDGDTITFKSERGNYFKEKKGKKCNTVRQFRMWQELKTLQEFLNEYDFNKPNKKIKIILKGFPEHFDSFERIITDIVAFEGYYIISWKHE